MKKIVIVVADGKVESVFVDTNEDVEVSVADFDANWADEDEQNDLANFVDHCRDTMKEIIC